jgi:hypothetical protein
MNGFYGFYNERMRRVWCKLRFMGSGAGRGAGLSVVLAGALGFAALSPAAWGQRSTHAPVPGTIGPVGPGSRSPSLGPPGSEGPIDPAARRQEERMENARNVQRQEQLVRDTNKLLALATELKTYVDKTNKDTLSVDVVKKAEEIEKLAKSVKDKMRQ